MTKENKMGIFNKTLQVESTSQIGRLLYSTYTLDLVLLTKVLMEECGEIIFALRVKYGNIDKYKSYKDERKNR